MTAKGIYTVGELNQLLKQRSMTMTIVWTSNPNMKWDTKVTILENSENMEICPSCRSIYSVRDEIWIERLNGRIIFWRFKCPDCGAILTVYNE